MMPDGARPLGPPHTPVTMQHYQYEPAPPRFLALYPLVLLVLIVLAGLLVYRIFFSAETERFDGNAAPRAITPRGNLAEDERTTIELFRNASPSVVHITNLARGRDRLSLRITEIPQGTGSGIIWNDRGYLVTNFHVIRGGSSFRVTLADQSTYEAIAVGGLADKDLGVLRLVNVPESKLRPIPIGTSSDLQVGQKVFAIGNPFGLDQTLTTGVISGLDREIKSVTNVPITGVIQTDAAINPGNSGGPLLDSAGRLIGMNTAIYSPSGAYAGIGFAVPVDTINRLAPLIIKGEKPARAGLGVFLMNQRVARLILEDQGISGGVLIEDLSAASAARSAGLRPTLYSETRRSYQLGDVLVGVDDEKVEDGDDLLAVLVDREVGETVTLKVLRDGRLVELPITLQALPSQ
jgi:S1-C subfamily serine protease